MMTPTGRRAALGVLTGTVFGAFSWAGQAQPRRREKPQPHMSDALQALQTAKKQLELGSYDHGGHRLKALDLVNKAIAEVEAGIQYANEHAK